MTMLDDRSMPILVRLVGRTPCTYELVQTSASDDALLWIEAALVSSGKVAATAVRICIVLVFEVTEEMLLEKHQWEIQGRFIVHP